MTTTPYNSCKHVPVGLAAGVDLKHLNFPPQTTYHLSMPMPKQSQSKKRVQRTTKNKKRLALKKTSRTVRNSPPRAVISHCSQEYLQAILDPFDGPLACVPTAPSIESQKVRTWAKGTFAVGTANFGFIEMSPLDMAANDASAITRSGSTYASSTMSGGAGAFVVNSNSTYASANFGDPETSPDLNEARVVAAGIRVRYTGTELSKGGSLYLWHHRNNGNLDGFGVTDYLAYQGASAMAVTRQWSSVIWTPVGTRDTRFGYNVGAPYGPYSLAAMVTGATGNTFEYEAAAVLEITGQDVRSMTPSHADPPGFNGAQEMQAQDNGYFAPYVGGAAARIRAATDGLADYLATGVSYANAAAHVYASVKQMSGQLNSLSLD